MIFDDDAKPVYTRRKTIIRMLPLSQMARYQHERQASVVCAVKIKNCDTIFNLRQSTELRTRFLRQSDQEVFEAGSQAATKTTPQNSTVHSRHRDKESYIQQRVTEFVICNSTCGDQMKEDQLDGTCSTHWGGGKCIKTLIRKPEGSIKCGI
jgi:hypothetical protein